MLGVVLRVPWKFCLLLLLLWGEGLIGDAGRGGRVGGRVGARRGRVAEEVAAPDDAAAVHDIVAPGKTLVAVVVMVVEVLVAVELRVVRHRAQDLSSVRVSANVR